MGLFSCDGSCATAEALRGEVQHLKDLVDKLLLSQSPGGGAAALLQHEQAKSQPGKKEEPQVYRSRTISRHPRALAQLIDLELFGTKRRQ